MALKPDTRVGPYRIVGTIGSGGMGIVYRAEDQRLGRPVAIKFVAGDALRDPRASERFQREARAASSLNHPNICTIYDIGEYDGAPFLVMELLEGETLASRIVSGPLPVEEGVRVAAAIADSLDAAHHRGIVHRDIKPGNIFITLRGEPKLLDFGLARLSGSAAAADFTATHTGTTAGTVAYMSPEQARNQPLDARSDLFSLGATLYEITTGTQPFAGTSTALVFDAILNKIPRSPSQLNPRVSPPLEHVILRALEKDPLLRYQTAADLRADLKRILRSDDVGTVPVTRPRWQRWPLVIATAAILAVGGVSFVAWRGRTANEDPRLSLEQITESGDIGAAAISDDGKFVAYAEAVSGGVALNIRNVQTKATVTIIPAGTHQYGGLTFSRDGAYLYVATRRPASLIRVPSLGGPSVRILDDVETAVDVSPDGRHLAYVRAKNGEAELVVASADGSAVRTVGIEKRPPIGRPAWSPDGQSIAWPTAIPGADAAFTLTASDGSRKEQVAIAGWQYVDSVVWLPTGRGFVIAAEEASREPTGRHQLLEVSDAGQVVRRLTNDLGDYHDLTGDPRTALASVQLGIRSGISVGPLATRDALHRVGSGGTDGTRGLTWTWDGRIAFTDAYSVGWIMKDDGTDLRPLLPERQTALGPFACGTAIGYLTMRGAAGSGNISVFITEPNAANPRHVADIPLVAEPTCTPDGAWLLYADNAVIKKVPTFGGEAVVVQNDGQDPRVSPDGQLLAARRRSSGSATFVIFSMKDNSLIRRLPGPAPRIYQWQPDSKALIYTRAEGNVANLWRAPVDGGSASQITQFTSDHIFSFGLSQDGRLVIARGETEYDVVLLRR